MKKELITFDQLAALSFLKFVKLDDVDMTLLMRGISDIAEVEIKDDSSDYFIMSDGSIMLEKGYIEKFYKNVDIELFEKMYGSRVMQYLNNINMFEFVLRKIKFLGDGCVVKDELSNNFSDLQIRFMKLLYKERYILDYSHQDDIYGEYQAVKLTKRGLLYLYLIDNKKEIDKFLNLLNKNGFNGVLLEAFLITQDLEKELKDVLTLDNFISFCEEYDKCPYVLDEHKEFKKVRIPNR